MNEDMPTTRDFSLFVSTPAGNHSPRTTPIGVNPHTFALTRIFRAGSLPSGGTLKVVGLEVVGLKVVGVKVVGLKVVGVRVWCK